MILYTYPIDKHVIIPLAVIIIIVIIILILPTVNGKKIFQATYHYNNMFYCFSRPPLIAALSMAMKDYKSGLFNNVYIDMNKNKPLELILCDKRMDILQWVRCYFSLPTHQVMFTVL